MHNLINCVCVSVLEQMTMASMAGSSSKGQCDWCAVGPGIGTAWKARLLADCVDAVREALLQPQRRAKDATSVRARAHDVLMASAEQRGWDKSLVARFVDDASVAWLRGRTNQALKDDLEAGFRAMAAAG